MKKSLLLLTIFCAFIIAKAQQPVLETVGTPTVSTPVTSYTGWANTSGFTFLGNAQVQNQEQNTMPTSTAGGNIFITNTVGTYFEVSFSFNRNDAYYPAIEFAMRNYNAASPNELVVERSINGGIYQTLTYQPYAGNFFLNGAWNYMTSPIMNTGFIGTNTFKYRFNQTSSTNQFRIDDINFTFITLLPIKLTSFSSTSTNNNTTLNWTANSSHASNSFILEKSPDGISFFAINTQNAKGSGTYTYSYAEANFVATTKSFYRLQMKDVSGKISYSNILAVNNGKKKADLIESIYPSPAVSSTTIALNVDSKEVATIEIFNMEGKKINTQTYLLAQGQNTILMDVSTLKAGSYILKASTKKQTQSINFMVVQ